MTGATVVRDPDPSLITTTPADLRAACAGSGNRRVWRGHRRRFVHLRLAVDHRGDHQLRETRRCPRHVAGVSLSWQIRTFWWSLWAIIISIVSFPLAFLLIGLVTWPVGMFILGVWAIYRIAVGWSRLSSDERCPRTASLPRFRPFRRCRSARGFRCSRRPATSR